MEHGDLVGESGLTNIKTEPEEVILYGCHVCDGLAFEDYDDLVQHLEKHLESDDVPDVKQENESKEVESNYDLASDDNTYSPSSDEEGEEESEEDQGYNQHLWEYVDLYEQDAGVPNIPQGDPLIKVADVDKLNQELSGLQGCNEGKENGGVKKRRKKVAVAEVKEFKCDVCDKSFERKHSLVIHLRVHTGERPYTCEDCGASYKQSGDLSMHLRTHIGVKPFSCGICKAKFLRRGDVNRHMIIHSKEKPFKCDACGRNYTRSYHLKLHWQNKHNEKDIWHGKDIRTGQMVEGKIQKQEKRYQCDLCSKTFKDRRNLKVHTQLHSGRRPFTCTVCKKSFAHSGSFNIHKRIHTGEKPFVCKICSERFNCSSAVGKHHRRVHEKS